jgi:hypothetical protein
MATSSRCLGGTGRKTKEGRMDALRFLVGADPLFLVQQEVPKAKTPMEKIPDIKNHIWIYDRSGSMYGILNRLGDVIIQKMEGLPETDTFSLGWFSGEGDYRFLLKGVQLTAKNKVSIAETIRKNLSARGTTCFSEILHDLDEVVRDLSSFGGEFALCFHTDGYPVVSNYQREIDHISKAIANVSGKIGSALMVGYGNYYNKGLMASMAEKFGGSLIHSEDLQSFDISLANFLNDCREDGQRVPVTIDVPVPQLVFGVNSGQIMIYAPDEKNQIAFTPHKTNKDYVFILTRTLPKGAEVEELTDAKIKRSHPLVRGAYAAAYILTQQTKTNVALEVLSALGDKAIIDMVNNAFTNSEYGRAEAAILESVGSPKARLSQGRDTMYLPPTNAFCLLDALDILQADPSPEFFTQHPEFDYSRIGRKEVNRDGYPKFVGDQVGSPLIDLVWNDTKLNLSVRVKVPGTIELRDGCEKRGFAKQYPTYVWRNYSLVKDGFLNVKKLPVRVCNDTLAQLETKGLKFKKSEPFDGTVVLDLTSVPIINRGIATGKTSATELCKKTWREIQLEARQKAIGWQISQIETSEKSFAPRQTLSGDQITFLEEHGIVKDGSFDPPSDRAAATDYYMAKEFEVKVSGFARLPKMADVLTKLSSGKPLTPVEKLLNEAREPIVLTEPTALPVLKTVLVKVKEDLRELRGEIQRTKFAILLGKQWFDEFTSREDNVLTIDGIKFTVSLREVKVDF